MSGFRLILYVSSPFHSYGMPGETYRTPYQHPGSLPFVSDREAVLSHSLHDGRYLVHGLLGTGGAAMVWRVFDRQLEVERAIKMVHTEGMAAHLQQRLHREAQVMARLSHDHVITIHDTFIEETRPCIVMELARGSVSDWVLSMAPSPFDWPSSPWYRWPERWNRPTRMESSTETSNPAIS